MTAHYGNELKAAAVENLDECVAICSSMRECAGFDLNWKNQPNDCYMKVKMENRADNPNVTTVHLINCRGEYSINLYL